MKRTLLSTLLLAVATLSSSAATEYGIYVGGVQVTSVNCNNITSSYITSGTVTYDSNSKTLTFNNVTASRTGGDLLANTDKGVSGLIVKFVGTNKLSVSGQTTAYFEKNTTIKVESGTTTINSVDYRSVHVTNNSKLWIKGPGKLVLNSTQGAALEGHGAHGDLSNDTFEYVYFEDGITAELSGNYHDILDVAYCTFNESCKVTLKATNNSQNPNVYNSGIYCNGKVLILEPYGAKVVSSTGGTIANSNGGIIYNKDIYISDAYAILFNSTYFPDDNFREALINRFGRGYMTSSQLAACDYISVSNENISDLTGVGYFTNLKQLSCYSNNLTSLPTLPSGLTFLQCEQNKLTSLPTLPTGLKTLDCSSNQLTSLPTLPSGIESLSCGKNQFTTLNITGLNALAELDVDNNALLTTLNCKNNSLTELSADNCPVLKTVDCSNNKFVTLTISNLNALTSLNLDDNASLTTLDCNKNSLTNLSIKNCTALKTLNCSNNKFTSISLTGRSALKEVIFSDNPNLTQLTLSNNALTYLYVKNCPALTKLFANGNQLQSLSLEGCNSLNNLSIARNHIRGTNMTSLINSLRSIPASEPEGTFLVYNQDQASEELNAITDEQVELARNKRWKPQKFVNNEWVDLGNPTEKRGDVNGDGKVDIEDVNAAINIILDLKQPTDYTGNADLNGDGKVDIEDVNAIINIILTQ